MPIGRAHHVIYDCPDPSGLAEFYSALLGLPITYRSVDFVVVAHDDRSSGFAFQLAPDHRPPDWPDPQRPQQVHLDVMVDDLAPPIARFGDWAPAGWRTVRTCTPTPPAIRSA